MRTFGRCLAVLISLPTIAVFAAAAPTAAAPPTSCPQYEAALQTYAPPGGWDVAQMSAIMARESNCDPTARSAHDSGLLQINDVNLAWLTSKMGTVDPTTLSDPTTNIRAAALLCTYWQARGKSCYHPWKLIPTNSPATPSTTTPAATPTPVPAPIAGRCTQYEALLQANAPVGGWDVQKMSTIMWRTSRCNATKRTSGLTGLLIIWDKTRNNIGVKGVASLPTAPMVLMVRNPNIKTIRDFTDKDRIAMPQAKSGPQATVLQMAAEKEWGPGQHGRLDELMISRPHPDAMAAMLSGGTEINAHFTNHPFIVAGQSTCGVEILEQMPEASAVLVPVGGGGLLAGIALACATSATPKQRVGGKQNRHG